MSFCNGTPVRAQMANGRLVSSFSAHGTMCSSYDGEDGAGRTLSPLDRSQGDSRDLSWDTDEREFVRVVVGHAMERTSGLAVLVDDGARGKGSTVLVEDGRSC